MPIDAVSRARLARVLRVARLPAEAAGMPPVLLPSDSNDAWRIGPVFLRICWRGDRGRFAREAAVTRALPSGVPYPEVLDTGSDGDLAWQVTRVVEGVPLATLWRGLSRARQRDAVHQIGQALAALHAHRFPAGVVAELAAPRPVGDTSASAFVGADITPLPLRRTEALLAAARQEGRADHALLDDVAARLGELADADPLADTDPLVGAVTCVHGDAHLANALWKDGRLTALLDFEWVRLGPPDLELEPYLRADVTGFDETEVREVVGWLAESYPALLATPDLVRRLWLYQLATGVRELFLDGSGQPRDNDAQSWLRDIVKGPDHVLRILPSR
ncbi:aminoglycoside phosphotransferase family protein [Actinoplanes sp. NPDC051411]|uniref:phosphotransferase family protein n=1 Tax=Actinoplanes sp. NPDC051411 TaxID=3155522 RepID=UPI00344A5758